MFTKAQVVCGIAGFLTILGFLQATPIGLLLITIGMVGTVIATKMHETD